MKTALFCLVTGLLLGSASKAAFLPARIEGVDLATQQKKLLSLDQKTPSVVVFLSSKCPCSHAHEASLNALATEFQKKGVKFLGVHANADEQTAIDRAHFKKAGLAFPVVADESGVLANSFGALKTPHAYVVKNGEIVYQGGVDSSADPAKADKFYLRDALTAVSAGLKPKIAQARALGCIIKRK